MPSNPMWVLRDKAPGSTGGVLTLGTFDGVHQGHKALLQACLAAAQSLHTHVEVWIYHPHPRTILRGESVPLLTTLAERLYLLEQAGVEGVRVVSFTAQLGQLSAEAFIREWIETLAQPKEVILGYDHRFGRAREGSAQLLKDRGIPVVEVPPYLWEGSPISSSRIRAALSAGAVEEAQRLLGYPYTVGGYVRRGQQVARTLGTPTANLPWPAEKVRLPAGIYVGWAHIEPLMDAPVGAGEPALLYLSPAGELEVHLLHGVSSELYERPLRVSFLRYLRPHQAFSDLAALQAQVQEDLRQARRFFGMLP